MTPRTPHQSQVDLGGHRVLLRPRRAVAGGGPDQPAVAADARAAAVGPGAWRPEPQASRLRRARRAHLALRPHLPDRDAGRHEHRPDLAPVDLRRRGRLRLPDHAVPLGGEEEDDRRRALAAGRRGIGGPPGAGRHAHRRPEDHRGPRHRPRRRRLRQRAVRSGAVHRHQPQADGRRLGGPDPVPGARRRQPGADGFQHAAPSRAAAGAGAAHRGHRPGKGRGPEQRHGGAGGEGRHRHLRGRHAHPRGRARVHPAQVHRPE